MLQDGRVLGTASGFVHSLRGDFVGLTTPGGLDEATEKDLKEAPPALLVNILTQGVQALIGQCLSQPGSVKANSLVKRGGLGVFRALSSAFWAPGACWLLTSGAQMSKAISASNLHKYKSAHVRVPLVGRHTHTSHHSTPRLHTGYWLIL